MSILNEHTISPQSDSKRTATLLSEAKMKEEYDFSNAEQGKFYVPLDELQVPIYLDKDIS